MDNRFFEQPVLNSPYEYPGQRWITIDTSRVAEPFRAPG